MNLVSRLASFKNFKIFVAVFCLLSAGGFAQREMSPTDARPKLGSGNTNRLAPLSNRSFGNVTKKLRALFSELTLLPEDSFDIVFYPERNPSTMAAIISDTRAEVVLKGLKGPTPRAVLYLSQELLEEVDSDDQLEGVLLHEFMHQVEDGQFKEWVVQEQARYVAKKRKINEKDGLDALYLDALYLMDKFGKDFQEWTADLGAQKHLLLRRRSPFAMIELFQKWHDKNQGKSRWQQTGLAGYLSRSHPDAAERIRALIAFNETMQGNKDVYPPELRSKPQSREFLTALRADMDTPQYRRDVLADLQDRLNRLHRERLQSIKPIGSNGDWPHDKLKITLNGYDFPSPPRHPALTGEGKQLITEGLLASDRALYAHLAHLLEAEMAKPLTTTTRARLTKEARLILERIEDVPTINFNGSDAEKKDQGEKHEADFRARLQTMPGVQAIKRTIESAERKVLVDLDQLFKKGKAGTSELTAALFDLPDAKAGDWLKGLEKRIPTAADKKMAALETAIELLTPNFDFRKLQQVLTAAEHLDLLEKLLPLHPAMVTGRLNSIDEIFSGGNRDWKADENLSARRSHLISDALKKAPVKAFSNLDWERFLKQMAKFKIPTEAYADKLGAVLKQRHSTAQVILVRSSDRHVSDLFATYDSLPELRGIVEPVISNLIRQYYLSLKDPEAFSREVEAAKHEALQILRDEGTSVDELDKFAKAWNESWNQNKFERWVSSIGERAYIELVADRKDFPESPAMVGLRQYWREQLPRQLTAILALPDRDFTLRAAHALRELENSPTVSKKQTAGQALRLQTRGAYHALLELGFLRLSELPELAAKLNRNRQDIFAEIFNGDSQMGSSPKQIKLLRRIFTKEDVKAALKRALAGNFATFRFDDVRAIFNEDLTLEDIVQLSAPVERKLDVLESFHIESLFTNEEAKNLRILAQQAANELNTGNLNFSRYINSINRLIAFQPRMFTVETERFDEEVLGATKNYLSQLQTRPYENRYDQLKNALFGVPQTPQDRAKHKLEEIKIAEAAENGRHIYREAREQKGEPTYMESRVQQMVEQAIIETVRPAHLARRLELYRLGRKKQIEVFSEASFVNSLFSDIMKAPLPEKIRLTMIETIAPSLKRSQTEETWTHFSKTLYAHPYDEKAAKHFIHAIFKDQADQADRKMNEVFHHYKLSPAQMDSLKEKLFPKDEVAGLAAMAKLMRATIRTSMSGPHDGIDFFRWLHGHTESVPPMASKINGLLKNAAAAGGMFSEMRSHMDNLSSILVSRLARNLSLNEFRDLYQRNNLFFRMVVTADLLNPLLEKSITHTKEGMQLLTDYLVDGMDVRNVARAKESLGAYLESNDQPGDNFLDQMMASAVKTDEQTNDAVRIKEIGRAKGGVWPKLLQMAYTDRVLIRDPEVREVFADVFDHFRDPTRPEKYRLLEEALGDEYAKIKQVHDTLGSGSINGTMIVELVDDKLYVARLVQGDPDTAAEHENFRLKKMSENLKRRGLAVTDPNLKDFLERLALVIDEYVPPLIEKMKNETDLSRERDLAELLKETYNKSYPDLGIEMELLTEASSPIEFDRGIETKESHSRKLANPKRVILYPLIDTLKFEALTPAEQRRIRRAEFRAEWEGFLNKNSIRPEHSFDSDGHKKNWLFVRSANEKLRLIRIDYSQGESVPADKVASFKSSPRTFFRYSTLLWGRPIIFQMMKRFAICEIF